MRFLGIDFIYMFILFILNRLVSISDKAPATRESGGDPQRSRATIDTPLDSHGQRIRATVSIGIAGFPDNAGAAYVLEKSDMALCERKQSGRNRVICHQGERGVLSAPA
jgi:GGDEF domain-containing protein